MTEPRRRRFDDLLGGGAPAPRGRRFDAVLAERQPTLEEIDTERAAAREQSFRPVAELSRDPAWEAEHTTSAPSAGKPVWSGGSTLGDAAYAAAGGAFSGLGVNPAQLGDAATSTAKAAYDLVGASDPPVFDVRNRIGLANERSPIAAPIGQMVGEIGIQAAALPARAAPVAIGAIGGALSGLGNADTDDWSERGEAALGGAAIGMGAGYVGGKVVDRLVHRPAQGIGAMAPRLAREADSQQLMHSGATRGDLKELDKLGGRQMYAERARALGLRGKPARVEDAAQTLVDTADAGRDAILAQAGPLAVDPRALGAGIRGANPYPGITNVDNAVERAAMDAERLGAGHTAGAPWDDVNLQRKYWGNKTNFASGTPESQARKGIYTAFNNELEDAINLADPGLGDAWRQLGRDEHVGIQLGDIATAARDRARDRPWHFGDVATFGALRVANANRHAPAEKALRIAAPVARGIGAADDFAAGLGLTPRVAATASGQLGADHAAQERELAQAALDDLHAGGGVLGPYVADVSAAYNSNEPGAVGMTIRRLIEEDPEFRARVLPMLTEMRAR